MSIRYWACKRASAALISKASAGLANPMTIRLLITYRLWLVAQGSGTTWLERTAPCTGRPDEAEILPVRKEDASRASGPIRRQPHEPIPPEGTWNREFAGRNQQ